MARESVYDLRIRGLGQTREEVWAREEVDARIGELARLQFGVVGRWQLVEAGVGKRAIERRVAAGRLHPLHSGIYAVGHRRIGQEGWWMAAVPSAGPAAVLSHRSAARHWGLRGYSNEVLHVTAPHKSTSTKRFRRHASHLPADERTVKEGIPITSVPRTIFDLAATEPLDVVKALLREMEFKEMWDRLSLWDLVERYPGRRGIRKVTAVLEGLKDEPAGEQKNPLEERFAPFLRRHRLPLPRFNDWIILGAKRFQVDCHWPGTSQIVELDGWQAHSTRTAFREDRARDRVLQVHGYTVTHFTWNQLDDEPEAIASDLRALLAGA
jgi:very-short-patch-repair endonuclease